jgi:regulator of Ty1 transposition protein 109
MATPQLADLLAEVLPKNIKLNVRHISTPPAQCEAIFSAPPGEEAETTFCENHFFVASLNRSNSRVDDEIAILGIEVAIYSTDRLTILFVSKADSSGYLHLLNSTAAPRAASLRLISTTFLSFLIQTHQRKGVRLVLSLFARAQSQYLFPGSADNTKKHVLDDRGLIKWWCQAADPILREHAVESQGHRGDHQEDSVDEKVESVNSSATAYLLVPGCDKYETRAFFPASARADDQGNPRWRVSYPLSQICSHPQAPPRCLIPRFPDDPKARFLWDLDEELPKMSENEEANKSGQWKSVKSLDEFWEMMSFRQECSAGRLVGFLWVVINPPGVLSSDKLSNQTQGTATAEKIKDAVSSSVSSSTAPASTTAEAKFDDRALPPSLQNSNQSETGTDAYRHAFFWPEAGRGEVILSEADYNAGNDVLLDQDFETEDLAMTGTMAWVRKVATLADVLWWGRPVTGKKEVSPPTVPSSAPVAMINSGLIVRKRKKDDSRDAPVVASNESDTLPGEDSQPVSTASTTGKDAETGPEASSEPGVNLLNASFVRKKKKT